MTPLLLPLHRIIPPPNIPAGMNPLVVMSIAYAARTSHHPIEPPILVCREGGYWRLVDGKHRWMGHYIAGRTHINATEIEASCTCPAD